MNGMCIKRRVLGLGLELWCWSFSYIVAVSFIVGGNRNTQRKTPICRKSL